MNTTEEIERIHRLLVERNCSLVEASKVMIAERDEVAWFAAGGGIARSGPYASQVEAWESMVLHSYALTGDGPVHPPDTRVWPERVRRVKR